ncbi:carbohydrate sulfotransferase 1 [Leucoraja erinacea]|uniref:carbohydrate sulfotransferase 1 n=1 Tax=Leucoraja erinaceus TaxID=7782 RepID=UPI00245580A7|nr:carbohydrate sulfotransferase 1 [Leucoraja erinacea]XP_055505199.1 carbohydrate sulfotransferase 1 [Leucoraja erinacea]XP_055505200.1 carbohydrate sulfotransferase 1 [Leucoraja erinacea]
MTGPKPKAMQCSWKAVLLLVAASLAVQYTAIRSFITKPLAICRVAKPRDCQASTTTSCPPQWPPTSHILVLATTRSGSSFVGQLLNQHSDIFYLFEPLYHVQTALINTSVRVRPPADGRRLLLGAYRDLLRGLFGCRLQELEAYIKPAPELHRTQRLFRRGASRALCAPPVCASRPPPEPGEGQGGGAEGERWEEGECVRKCGSLNLTLASRVCLHRHHVAIKTVRIPEVGDLRTLLEDPRLNLKVIQLVRDPRGILASRIDTFPDSFRAWKIWRNSGRKPYNLDASHLSATCADFLRSAGTGLARPGWLKGRYMLVRYEDLAREPEKKTREIYRFLGVSLDANVKRWILNNTRGAGASGNHKYATVRDSAATAEGWRLKLTFDMVELVQDICNLTLAQLGYRMVNSAEELRNVSISLAEDRTFLPFL